ncbi:hypothetical protein [Amycolatopsis sp. WAC 04197]|uniref:tetratricopeptide repeat protein n=1 Tax=Amycolatopsis sp. WAC 04197 TaxID=2203199 RepID=UPI000F769214|nr:hypothetical protein [Amycolatopsis sp. WAC 04197]
MSMVLIARMQQRLARSREDSDDTTVFLELMYLGELTLKIMVAGMLAATEDDRDRHRYRLEYGLVRASGLGEWCDALDDLLTGPASANVTSGALPEKVELAKNYELKVEEGWQSVAVNSILEACRIIDPEYWSDHPNRVAARIWARHFTWLRNKTRGHGATTIGSSARMVAALERSILAIIDNFKLFRREWAYLHRNLSGKYRVVPVTEQATSLERLKRQNDSSYEDGIYIVYGDLPFLVPLIFSDVELNDFFLCNGGYTDAKFEALSYVTDTRKHLDAQRYVSAPTQLPMSETQGLGSLEMQGGTFGNLPSRKQDYISRPQLEESLERVLRNDRHAIVTLVGRGGTGKTSLALEVLHRMAIANEETDRYLAILWFSARDVDLTSLGPKLVRPRVVSIADIADQYIDLVQPSVSIGKGSKKVEFLAEQLGRTEGPLLYVFDNFETVRDPQAMYEWFDTYIRPPNKILITTRLRDFKGDYPVEVGGMRKEEFDQLISATSIQLEISQLLTPQRCSHLFDHSDGHPYIAKLLLSDIANQHKWSDVNQLVAGKDDLLQALFERTYTQLSPLARRIFLTLCGWRSAVPRLAIEAALLRSAEEPLDTGRAVDQLVRSSMADASRSDDGDEFLAVPLAASLFGRKKLQVSPLGSSIEADLQFLHMFGATRGVDVSRGIKPKLIRMFKSVAVKIQAEPDVNLLDTYLPVLEHIARRYAPAWLMLADLYEEQQQDHGTKLAIECVRHYLEERPESLNAWSRLALLSRRQGDFLGEAQALVSRSMQPGASYELATEAAWRISALNNAKELAKVPEDELAVLVRTLLGRLDLSEECATATDYSRMAWLAVIVHDMPLAADYVLKGADRDPSNPHIRKLQSWLSPDLF